MHDQGIKVRKQIISVLILLALIVITFFYYLKGYTLQDLRNAFVKANFAYLLSGLSMMVLFVSCEALNIYLILKTLNHKVPFLRCFEYASIGFYFSSITPSASGGQPAQIYYMKQDKIPIAVSSVTIFFIVYVYQITMILSGFIMTLLRFSQSIYFINKLRYLFIYGFVINTGVIFILFSLMYSKKAAPSIAEIILKAGNKLRLIKKVEETRNKLGKSLTSYRKKATILKEHPSLFFKILGVTIIQMTALNSIPYLVYCSMGYRAKGILDILTCQSLLTISVSAVPLPGAEGVAQGGFLQIFDSYFPQDMLTYAMLINRIISFYLPLILSFIMYIFTHIRTTKQSIRGDILEGKQN
ncbi:lysylphosphatidylglycerol synthase transmembrane domain-containing protein [Anaerocolumna sp.]|uniref:lysylphosphatidylglycerol synthase transmembrane domain-containing protein n=1 Tax=Anaerocolumna sp. TaxID=2041569 RepID=UPI0028B085D2|nr:lysylphosphatidylglycerol synthase transmembrane domain-containing protein [Anaerocolumna sp.]